MAQHQRDVDLGARVGERRRAWDEWKKNSLAIHAEKYPEIWYGTWSGPDTYNSALSKHPGQTMFAVASPDDQSPLKEWGMSWTDFPVMNLHPHAWPLYSSAKLLGLEFHEKGIASSRRCRWLNTNSLRRCWDSRKPKTTIRAGTPHRSPDGGP